MGVFLEMLYNLIKMFLFVFRSLMAMSLYSLSEMHILLLLGGSWAFLGCSTYGLTKSSAPLFIHKANQTLLSNPAVIVMFCWPRIVCSVCKIMTKAWYVIYARVICLIIFSYVTYNSSYISFNKFVRICSCLLFFCSRIVGVFTSPTDVQIHTVLCKHLNLLQISLYFTSEKPDVLVIFIIL